MSRREDKIKHLEFIENNITRMNSCSFYVKGWNITISSALLALFAAVNSEELPLKQKIVFIVLSIIPSLVFWYLDGFYLQQERKFRGLYDDVAEITDIKTRKIIKPYAMPLNLYTGGRYDLKNNIFSKTLLPFYLISIFSLVTILTILLIVI